MEQEVQVLQELLDLKVQQEQPELERPLEAQALLELRVLKVLQEPVL